MSKLDNAAVLGVHLQNDVIHDDGGFAGFFAASATERNVVTKAARIIDAAHEHQVPTIFTRVGWDQGHTTLVANTPLLQIVDQQRCLKNGTWQTQILDEIVVADEDLVLTNERVSSFSNSNLDTLLRAKNVQTLIVFGVATNVAVESTVRAASDLGYRVILVEDACSTTTEQAHSASVESMGLFAEVTTTEDILSRL